MQYLTTKLVAFVLISSVSTTAFANRDGSRAVTRLDTDGDGLVSRDEFHTPDGRKGSRMLERADLDGDGAVTLEEATQASDERMAQHQKEMSERQAKMAARLQETFVKMDANGDGTVTMEEMRLFAFDRIDENRDGYLSADEFNAAGMDRKMGHRHGGDISGDRHRRWEG
jgi:Ca2+-binding EF-hand superfamily protein